MSKAVALFSGGLDSMLAARLVMDQGVEVIALHFITPFFGYKNKGREQEAADEFFEKYGIRSMVVDVSEDYIAMVRNPKYGYGKNFNPCIDCKIFMMQRAKKVMEEIGADFVVTGEVLGQRPMSQRIDALRIVERDSGLTGYLLRPLSAKLLKPTLPEENGLVDREKLMDISGRARRRQMELAESFGISDYQTPAGGCLLTDPIISKRIEILLKESENVEVGDVQILGVGRHFTLEGGTLYVGRNKDDNARLANLARSGDYTLKAKERPGPLALFRGVPDEDALLLSARIVARYADADEKDEVAVGILPVGGQESAVTVLPADAVGLDALRSKY